ncbi:MAG: PspA/IM30 family protein [Sphingomicrobium sp.]
MPDFDLEPIEAVAPVRVTRIAAPSDPVAPPPGLRFAPLNNFLSGPVFSRARDIIAANMTDLLDRAEDPARMIRVIIIEMEETLVEIRATAARTIADMKEMGRALIRLEQIETGWTDKAELALSKGRDDLAHAALAERSQAADMAGGLRAEIDELNAVLKSYEADIARLQAKLREARARQASIASRIESAVARARVGEALHGSRTEEAFARFEQLERRADLAEGMADALGMTGPRSLEEELAELRSAEKIDTALEELKAARAARQS